MNDNEEVIDFEGKDYIHNWFGLSYANYLVLPRSILQSMPTDWQKQFVQMLDAIEDEMNNRGLIQQPDYQVNARDRDGKFIKDVYRHYWKRGCRCLGPVDVFNDNEFKCYNYNEDGESILNDSTRKEKD